MKNTKLQKSHKKFKLSFELNQRKDFSKVGNSTKHRFLENYTMFISLLALSGMLIYVPFSANNQPVNFISINNNETTTQVSQHIALINTIIFYPLLLLFISIIFGATVLKLKNKDIKYYERIVTYSSLVISVMGFISQYSKFLYGPYLLLFLVLFFKKQILRIKQKLTPVSNKIKKTKVVQWILSHPLKLTNLMPHICYWMLVFLDTLWIFKANLGNGTMDVFRIKLFWVNILLVLLIFYALRAITREFWGPALFTTVATSLFYLFDVVIDKMRNDAIVPSQLAMIKSVKSLASMVSPIILITVGISVVLIIYLSRLLSTIYPIKKPRWYNQIISLILAISAFGSTFYWNQPKLPIADFMSNQLGDNRQFYNQAWGAKINGPLIQFLNNVDIQTMKMPAGYSKNEMQKVAKRYQREKEVINKSRKNKINDFTVIYNLSESFADPKRVPTVSYKGNPISHIQQLKKENQSGIMLSSGYGGGTANMEYMTLTSMPTANLEPTLATPYTQIVPLYKHTYSIADQFTHTSAIHPYNNTMYDRTIDYPKLGIHTFYNIENKKHPIKHQTLIENNPYLSDQTAYENVEDQLRRCQKPQFINLVTMQNHTPWDNKYSKADKWDATAGYGTDENVLNQYLQGINYTDQAVNRFYKIINKSDKPIVWIFYGDHLPGMYQNPMSQDGLLLHQTDYFIYLNPAAKAKVEKQQIKNKYVDPNEFTAETLKLTNSKVTSFQAMQTLALEKLPVKVMRTNVNTTNQYSGNLQWINPTNGKIITHPKFNKQQKQLWHDYKLIQYDQCAGKHYLPESFFK